MAPRETDEIAYNVVKYVVMRILTLTPKVLPSDHFAEYEFTWETFISRSPPPSDSGCVAVVDGSMSTCRVMLSPVLRPRF